ncbi:MAG TPA: hypothetical protein VML50_10410 [Anaeromyxobacter sp.]|nr:hypothetical protein [Anaeromyxobacter sp.]
MPRMTHPPLFAAGILAALGLGAHCQPLPAPQCPGPATSMAGPGQPELRAGKSTLDVELSGGYVSALVLASLGLPQAQPCNVAGATAQCGYDIQGVTLAEVGTGATRTNRLSVQVAIWMVGQGGAKVYLPDRTYLLRLQLVPYRIAADTFPALAQRQALLGCGPTLASGKPNGICEGLVLNPERPELDGGPNFGGYGAASRPVDCTAPGYDLIDAAVLKAVMGGVGSLKPVAIDATSILDTVSQLSGAQATHVVGLDVGSDRDLKLGLVLDQGTALAPFDSSVALGPPVLPNDVDWAVRLDTGLVTAAIGAMLPSQVAKQNPSVSVTVTGVTYTQTSGLVPGDISVTATGTISVGAVPLCHASNVPLTLQLDLTPGVCKNAQGTPVLQFCPSGQPTATPKPTNTCESTELVAANFDQVMATLGSAILGDTVAVVRTGSFDQCGGASMPMSFTNGSDVLYPVAVYTGGVFYLGGRSKLMDQQKPGRTALPAACP